MPLLRFSRRSILRGALLGTFGVGVFSLEGCGGSGKAGGGETIAATSDPSADPPAPVISLITPSVFTIFTAGEFTYTIYGSNFTPNSTVLIQGTAVATFYESATKLTAETIGAQFVAPATYSVVVRDPNGTSNAASFTVYTPGLGPQPFDATPGYQMYPAGGGGIAISDVNGDGFGDVIMNGLAPSIAVFPGQKDGTLGVAKYINGVIATALAVGDINGDGIPDIIGVNPSTNAFVPLLNDGKANFTLQEDLPLTGDFPGPLALADVTGSGRNDLLAVCHHPDVLYLYPNLGGGKFGPAQALANLGPDRSFTVADFDGDGRADIAYSGINSLTGLESTQLLINKGGGSFTNIAPAPLSSAGGLVVSGDFNSDGLPDLAVETTQGVLQVFLNQGNLNFSPVLQSATLNGPFQLAVGDFDNDGILDMAGVGGTPDPGSIVFLWGDGSGVFAPEYVTGPIGSTLAVGDINGDGIPDVAIPDLGGLAVSVVLGRKGRGFPNPLSFPIGFAGSIIAGDINGDGLPDLFFAGATQPFLIPGSIYLNQGDGVFQFAGSPPGQAQTFADLTGSGKADMIGFTGPEIMIWPGTGDFNFRVSPIAIQVPPPGLAGFLSGDLDGDGLPELIAGGLIAWNNGKYQFDFERMNFDSVYGIADVNNDGRLDLLTDIGTLLNQGNRQFTLVTPSGLPLTAGTQLAMGDFDGDGILDAAVTSIAEASFLVAKGRGDGTFVVRTALGVAQNGTPLVVGGIAAADFLGAGRSQILVLSSFSSHFAVYSETSQGEFAVSFFATGAYPPAGFAVADFNGDGRADVAILGPDFVFLPYQSVVIVLAG